MIRQPSLSFRILRQNRLWISRFLAVFVAIWQIGQPLQAASAIWNGSTDGNWATVTNWSATPVPGTGDTATFNNAGGGFTTIDLGAGVTLNSLLFDTALASAYTIGSAPGQVLTLNAAGNITMNDTVAANQTVAANLALGATATFNNASTTNSLLLNGVISGATAISKTGAGILELNGNNTFTGITTISAGTVKLGHAAALGAIAATDHTVVGAGATLDLNGLSIAESFGRGGATLPLDGFVDATAILTNSNATAAAITGAINFNGGGAFTVNGAAGNITLSRVARTNGTSGDGLITKEGTNTLILAGTLDNVSLQVTVNNGVVQLNKGSTGVRALGGATTTIGAAGTLRLTTGQTNLDQIFANVNVVNNGIFDLQGQNEGFNSMTGTGQVTNGATNDPSTLTLGENNGTFTWGGAIQDGAGTSTVALTKVGIGTMTITNNNTYTGTTSMNGAGGGITLDFAAVGGGNDNLIAATSALSLTNTSAVRTQILTVTGDASVTNNQTFASTTFATTADRRYQIATSSGAGGTLNLNLGAFNNPSGVFVDFVLPSAGGIFTSNAAGILANTYTVNNGGSLAQVLGGQRVGFSGDLIGLTGGNVDALAAYTGGARHLLVDSTSTGDVTQSAGTLGLATIQITDAANRTLAIGTGNTLAVSSTGGAGTIIRGNAAGSVVIGAAASPGELTAGTAAGDDLILSNSNATGTLTVNSTIKNNAGGAVDVVIGGATAATTLLTAANSFTGTLTLQTGTLRINNANALGTTAGGTTVSAGSALELTGGISVGDEALSINGAGVSSAGALRNLSGVNTYGGLVTASNTPEIQVETGTTLIFDRTVSGASVTTDSNITFDTVGTGIITFNDAFNTTGGANPTIAKGGSGTLNFTAANTWAGNGSFTLNDGVVRISNGGALGGTTGGTSVTDNAALELIGGITTTEAITLVNTTGIGSAGGLRNISGNNIISGTFISNDTNRINSDADTLTISGEFRGDPDSGQNRTVTLGGAGNITLSGIVRNGTGTTNGVLTVVKDGAGTLTLSNAANAYTGNTTISAGSLALSGNINPGATAAILTMASGTTLNQSSTGVLAGALSVVLNNATTTFAGTNTATGTTAFNGGSLTLDYGTNNTSKLADAAALTLGGGTINLVGGSHREQVLSTTLTAGTTTIVNRPSGTSFLALGAVTPGAGALLSLQGNDFASTTTPNTGGILGGWATVTIAGVTDWGVNSGVTDGGSGSFIRQFTGPYTDITRLGPSTIVDDVTQNVRIINGGTAGNITLASTTNEVNTLKMDASDGPATIDMTGSVLNIGLDSGSGIIQTAASGGLIVGAAANQGTLTTGGTANATAVKLGLANDSLTQDLTINSVIADNGTDVVSINKAGAGRVVINGTNTNTGNVTIQAGTLHVGAVTGASTTGSLGAGTAVVNNGTFVFRRTDTAAVDLAGSISGSGAVQYLSSGTSNQGQFTANNASTYTGGTLIDDARVAPSNATAFGTGLVTIAPGGQAFLGGQTYTNPFTISGNGWTETAGTLGAIRLAASAVISSAS
ncbi:MAG: autotransporter-associated beta strand repeat-containing protein, partial [Verrucomicrobia bacterium]|nr:autotransporter-associated beta strand repeat-containing protein [Verrucomicrobiota bacterium]